jgi:DNA-directed RNA polymerase specialized sigma24 family protein
MTGEGSITAWLGKLTEGDRQAVQPLWRLYFHRLVGLARSKLRDAPRRAADEEDVALSAFDSFCRGAEQGRFPDLADRDDLWGLLLTITARKAFHLLRDQQRQKRGGPGTGVRLTEDALWEEVLGREPSPDVAAEMTEAYHRLLDLLPDPELRSVAVWKLEGYRVEEMAQRLDCSPRTVKRMARLTREIWEKEVEA